jgi:hypothetical protein
VADHALARPREPAHRANAADALSRIVQCAVTADERLDMADSLAARGPDGASGGLVLRGLVDDVGDADRLSAARGIARIVKSRGRVRSLICRWSNSVNRPDRRL